MTTVSLPIEYLLVAVAVLLILCVLGSKAAGRLGVPALLSRSMALKGGLKLLLELESGSNAPMAIYLTTGLTQLVLAPSASQHAGDGQRPSLAYEPQSRCRMITRMEGLEHPQQHLRPGVGDEEAHRGGLRV